MERKRWRLRFLFIYPEEARRRAQFHCGEENAGACVFSLHLYAREEALVGRPSSERARAVLVVQKPTGSVRYWRRHCGGGRSLQWICATTGVRGDRAHSSSVASIKGRVLAEGPTIKRPSTLDYETKKIATPQHQQAMVSPEASPKQNCHRKYAVILDVTIDSRKIDFGLAERWLIEYLKLKKFPSQALVKDLIFDYMLLHKLPDPRTIQNELAELDLVDFITLHKLMRRFWQKLVDVQEDSTSGPYEKYQKLTTPNGTEERMAKHNRSGHASNNNNNNNSYHSRPDQDRGGGYGGSNVDDHYRSHSYSGRHHSSHYSYRD